MKAEYKEIRKEADELYHLIEEKADDREHDVIERARLAARDVREAIESDKGPRTIADKIERARASVEAIKQYPEAMSPNDIYQLLRSYELLHRDCHHLPGY